GYLAGCAPGRRELAVPRPAATAAERLRRGRMAALREQPTGPVLLADASRAETALGRARGVRPAGRGHPPRPADCLRRPIAKSLLRRLRARIRYRRFDAELAEEIEFHRAMKQRDWERAGLAATEARVMSHRDMGNVTLAR